MNGLVVNESDDLTNRASRHLNPVLFPESRGDQSRQRPPITLLTLAIMTGCAEFPKIRAVVFGGMWDSRMALDANILFNVDHISLPLANQPWQLAGQG